jgi:uncharacterized protein (TIRG00374 family)
MSRQKRIVAIGLLVGVIICIQVVVSIGPQSVGHDLVRFGFFPLLGFVSISLLNFCLYTWRWKMILDDMSGRRASFMQLFLHRMSGFAGGYLTPGAQVAGEPVRVAMLVGDGYSAKMATSSVVIDLAFEIITFVLYVVVGITLALASGITTSSAFLFPIVFVSGVLLFMVAFFVSIIRGKHFFSRIVAALPLKKTPGIRSLLLWMKETEGIMTNFFLHKSWKVVAIITLSCAMTLFKAIEVLWIAYFFGTHVTFFDTILVSTIPGIALLLPVPGGLGVFEGGMAALFGVLHLGLNPIAYTAIIRVRDAIFIIIGVAHAAREGISYVSSGARH